VVADSGLAREGVVAVVSKRSRGNTQDANKRRESHARCLSDARKQDDKDVAIAKERLAEIGKHPERVLQGVELDAKLKEWES